MDESARKRIDLPRLTSLRAFAALSVMAYHLMRHSDLLPREHLARYGFAGVGFFFILSGFVLTWSISSKDRPRDFWLRRFARVYPSHFVMACVAIVAPVTALSTTPLGAVANFALIQSWFLDWRIAFGLNAVSWSLACEAFFYAIAPFGIARLMNASSRRAVLLALAWVVITASVAIMMGFHSPAADVYAYTNPLVRSGEFTLGIILAIAVGQGWRPRVPLGLSLAGLAVVYGLLAKGDGTLPQSVTDVLLTTFFAAVILSAALSDLADRPGILRRRSLVYLGEVSFAFYLVHELVILNVVPLLPDASAMANLAFAACVVLFSLIAAAVLHHGVELPMQRKIRSVWGERSGRATDNETLAT